MDCSDPSALSQESYPARQSGFSYKFGRLLAKCAVAQDIGTVAAYLLRVISDQEDAVRFRRAVKFWDSSLMTILGCSSQKTLATARKKAVEAGWLHYEHGAKGRAGLYWVLIPQHATGISDDPIDDCQLEFPGECDVKNTSNRGRTYGESGDDQGTNVRRNGQPFLPNTLNTNDTKGTEERARSGDSVGDDSVVDEIPQTLSHLIESWNALPDGIAPKVVKPNSPSILKGWAKVMRDPETKAIFGEVETLMDAIRAATFCHGQGWFDLSWLFAKGGDRVMWNVTKVISGKFADKSGRQSKSATMELGPGQVFAGYGAPKRRNSLKTDSGESLDAYFDKLAAE